MKSYPFTIKKGQLEYSDAIIVEDDVELTEQELEALKQERFDNWYAIITAPPIEGTEEVVAEEVITPTEEV